MLDASRMIIAHGVTAGEGTQRLERSRVERRRPQAHMFKGDGRAGAIGDPDGLAKKAQGMRAQPGRVGRITPSPPAHLRRIIALSH
jgi:hypothetical protein